MENIDNNWKMMIEQNISSFLGDIDFKHPDFDLKVFKSQLKNIIGVEPSVKIKWNSFTKVNELKKQAGVKDYKEVIEQAEQLDITFIDENNNPIQLKYFI